MLFSGVLGALLYPLLWEYGHEEGFRKGQLGASFIAGWPAGGSTLPVPETAQGNRAP